MKNVPVLLYGCETWSLVLREKRRPRLFENRILTRIFGYKRNANGKGRRLHNQELRSLYCPPNIVRLIKSRRLKCVARMGGGRSYFKFLTGKLTGGKTIERSRSRLEGTIRMDLRGITKI